MSLIDELKRRNVFKVSAAYLALGWVVTQVTATVTPAFHLPDSALPLVTWIGVIGFPFVVVFAWVYELTPEGLKRESEVDRSQSITRLTSRRLDYIIIAMLALAIGLFALQYFRPPRSDVPAQPAVAESSSPESAPQKTVPAKTAAAVAADDKSIAVLPFENRSRLEDDAFFVDGIHDDILTQLTKIGALKVIARTSVEQFRNTQLTIREIGEKLGVARVLEGGVQRAGERVRINVQLIDVDTDAHLWAETYDRELNTANIFAIQSEVAMAIAGALEATLTPGEKARVAVVPTQNLEAWEAYQLGKQRMAKRTSTALQESEKFFNQAIALDAKFALAYVGLADALNLQTFYSDLPSATGLAAAENTVEKALALDPNLTDAWASSGSIAHGRQQFDRAEPMFRRAIEFGPNNATAHHWYSMLLQSQGRFGESMEQAEQAVELDPLSAIINENLAGILELAGRFDEAEARDRKAIEIDPSMPNPYSSIGAKKAYAHNRYADAVPLVEQAIALDPNNPQTLLFLLRLYLDVGDDARATQLAESAREHWHDNASVLGLSILLQVTQGHREAALPDAQKLLALDPRSVVALFVLRNADLESGQAEAAHARYAQAYPELLASESPEIDGANWPVAIDFALVLQRIGESHRATVLLDRSEAFIRTLPRLGSFGFGIADAQISALRGETGKALAALRSAEQAGWRWEWRYNRDFDPTLASIRNEPGFKTVFADIEKDMAAQRARLVSK